MKIFFIAGLLFCMLYAQAGEYAVQNIPAPLLKEANAVVREHLLNIRIVSNTEVYTVEKIAITIFNEHAADLAYCRDWYGRDVKVSKIEGTLYDAQGKELKKVKHKDIRDRAVYDYVSVSDVRYKEFSFHHAVYPFTVVYEVEKKYSTLAYLPDMELLPDYKVSMQKALLAIESPADINIKTRAYNVTPEIIPGNEQDGNLQKFAFHDLHAVTKDNFTAPAYFPLPTVVIAPTAFTLQEYTGDFSDWKKFGSFFYTLNRDRDALPEDIKAKVHSLADTCHTDTQKIQVLYKYLQAQTRYVSIQLGIGGWQTFDANSVAKNGYGDCKALSNYMKAMLKEAGITSYEVLVWAGRNMPSALPPDFSHNVFNHVILSVPLKNDTVWLECTADDLPAGFLSNFTDDRDVLMITPAGGVVVHTPVYGINENRLQMQTMIRANSSGAFKGNAKFVYSGCLSDMENSYVNERSREETETYLNRKLGLPSYKVTKFGIDKGNEGAIPQLTEHMDIEGIANITQTGKRLYIIPTVADMGISTDAPHEERTMPFFIHNSFQVTDTTIIELDNAYTAEMIPVPVNHVFPFGAYTSAVSFEAPGTIKITRTYRQVKGSYPAAMYKDFLKLDKATGNNLSQQKVVLLKKD